MVEEKASVRHWRLTMVLGVIILVPIALLTSARELLFADHMNDNDNLKPCARDQMHDVTGDLIISRYDRIFLRLRSCQLA